MIRSKVVLPDPLGPSSERNSSLPYVQIDAVDCSDAAEMLADSPKGQHGITSMAPSSPLPSSVLSEQHVWWHCARYDASTSDHMRSHFSGEEG